MLAWASRVGAGALIGAGAEAMAIAAGDTTRALVGATVGGATVVGAMVVGVAVGGAIVGDVIVGGAGGGACRTTPTGARRGWCATNAPGCATCGFAADTVGAVGAGGTGCARTHRS